FKENAPIGEYPTLQGYEALVIRIAKETQESKQWGPLEPYADGLWQAAAAKDHPQSRGAIALSLMVQAALEDDAASIAVTLCRTALNGPVGRKLFPQQDWGIPDIKARVSAASGKAALAIGAIDIPVDELDPTYPVYKSQAEFALGNVGAAWDLYDQNAELLEDSSDEPLIRKMTPGYCLWLLERNIEDRDTERAEALVKELMIWSRRELGSFTPQQEAELKIAYADTAFQKGNYQTARAWYRRVADAAEHQETELQYKSALRSVMVDRVSKNFGSAITELDKLMLIRDDSLRMRAHFARAEVFYDQEKYVDAYDEVTAVLKRAPNHADALILLGKAQLEMRKLVDASEIELGATRDQGVIVPGEMIKINLNDPSLNVAGVGADIEVEIWAESGDRERVMLHQLGDDKSKYRAEVPTKLAAPQAGDKTLQVLGRDKIRYGYSKEFRAKMTDLPPDPELVIGVASNARLNISAGAFPARTGERRLDLSELGISTAQQALGTRNVRPGNPIYLRVFDPDQSVTADVDEIVVSLTTSSGDVISQLRLTETGTHTGEFEAIVPTGTAQALAYASESSPGSDPNMVISAEPYPGWSGAVGSKASGRALGIDLNDNVPLDKMTVHCTDPTLAPTHFVVQTSMNGRDWTTRARFPDDPAPWNGRPTFASFHTHAAGVSISAPKGRELPADWLEKLETTSAREACRYRAAHVTNLSAESIVVDNAGHPNSAMLVRFRALFYQPVAAIRTFQLAGLPPADHTQTVFLLDGQPVEEDADDPLTVVRELRPGVHEIQVWRNEQRGELQKRKPHLLCDVSGQEELEPCPDSMFDPAKFPAAIRKTIDQPASVTANEAKTEFDIAFAANTQARIVRLVIEGQEGAAPAIHKITLTDRDGKQRLPVETDYQQLRNNQQLEVIPGDQISVRYEDTCVIAKAGSNGRTTARYEGRLGVAYNTAMISASFLNYELNGEGERQLVLEDIRRFKMDDAVAIVITDPDMDISSDRDQIEFKITAVGNGGGQPVDLDLASGARKMIALETEPHSGVFLGRVFPVLTTPSRDSEIQVAKGGTLTAIFRDTENLDPGIPTDRTVTIEHARYATPALAVYNATTEQLPLAKPDDENPDDNENGPEIILPRRTLHYAHMDQTTIKSKTQQALIGANLRFDVIAPHLAFADSSTLTAYVQTDRGRKQAGETSNSPFDVRVPGTLKLEGWVSAPTGSTGSQSTAGYISGTPAKAPTNTPPLDEGRFSFSVPLILGDLPTRSYATSAADSLPSSQIPDGLAVRAGDKVHVGYPYKDDQGKIQWHTSTVTLTSDAFLDVMNGRYRREITKAFVGEKLYIRLIAPGLDQSPDRDVTTVNLKAASGAATAYQLRETSAHSGHFKGSFALGYASEPLGDNLPSVVLHGFPVKYGDEVTVSVSGKSLVASVTSLSVSINKGADGTIQPFSKRYGEDGVAIKTTFTLAECFFELAKHHRKMNQESLARREMSHAQKLLAEAIASHQDDELKAHAEYLLGNLAQEYADLAKNEASKQLMYQDALARFSKIPLDYPDTEFAPQAQFKKALVYEKMGQLDISVEEYVKLAYKYPEHELIPSVMSRLGSYFQKQGLAYKKKAEALDKKENDVDASGEAIRFRELATKEYLNAATVFGKLQSRFPDDPLAGLAGLRSAQNYMRAGDYKTAVEGFKFVVDNESYDARDVRAQALYWSGLSHERLNSTEDAYQIYRRTTFDFPDSIWAKYSRGRLADPVFEKIIEREELARERLLESLKK
ncbi:MAG: tetratricopeptide (TPR) repeat protein, partial [Hyphomicrobiaceae bacterium]